MKTSNGHGGPAGAAAEPVAIEALSRPGDPPAWPLSLPHLAEELWQRLVGNGSGAPATAWPVAVIPPTLIQDTVNLVIQVKGKVAGSAGKVPAEPMPPTLSVWPSRARSPFKWLKAKPHAGDRGCPGKLVNLVPLSAVNLETQAGPQREAQVVRR